ncbi:hypothetical protein NPIL_219341 [Nephila pilipes]|uniref:Uncharacterized protein n=1 Tax=Nephila pilipes TaxID=299642 RepID=A0A8X6NY02_NEPPI|nr:hypothetical protein NPIL_219341 [Nephila pilipes]
MFDHRFWYVPINLQGNLNLHEQLPAHATGVHHLSGKRYDRYMTPTVKHPPNQMVCGAISVYGTTALYFQPPKTTMNISQHLNLLCEKLKTSYGCSIFMHTGLNFQWPLTMTQSDGRKNPSD